MTINILYQMVGKTRSGKNIVCVTNLDKIEVIQTYFVELTFSAEDLFDAFAVFEYLSLRAKRKEDPLADLYEEHSIEIHNLLPYDEYELAKLRAGVLTVFDLRKLGESLVGIEFKDS